MSQTSAGTTQFKILLVENSRTARAVLLRQLQNRNYDVDAVATGIEAIQAILQADYQLVIMDVFMPQMNGYEAAQNIRAMDSKKSNTIIIGFSSSTEEKDKEDCLAAGMNEYIIKSDDNEALFSQIAKYKQSLLSQQKAG